MIRTAFFLAGLCALLWTGAAPAHAGGWSLKKMRKSVQKRADEIGDAGRKVLKSKPVVKTKGAVEKAGTTIADGARSGAKAVGSAARSASRKIRFGFRGTKRTVQAKVAPVSGGVVPCPPPPACPPSDPC